MIHVRRARPAIGAAAVCCLLLASIAYGATSGRFHGRTSQHERISFRLSGGFVTKLRYYVLDRCPGRALLRNHDFSFPPMRVRDSRFGGKFVDGNVATAIIRGRVSGRTVAGKLIDRVRDRKTHKLCRGRATFRLKHS